MSDLAEFALDLQDAADDVGDEQMRVLARFLRQRIALPDAYVVALGETCSGKSLLLNSMLRNGILPVQGVPSTGAVAEIAADTEADAASYFIIYRDAKMQQLDEDEFLELAVHPDEETQRLRAVVPTRDADFSGVRLFDTPGYGSLVREHEEVLQVFLPNCDAVVYVVSYRTGFQQNDYEFLRGLKALARDGIPFYLVVNRVPQGTAPDNRRVQEIHRHVAAFLEDPAVPLFLVPNEPVQAGVIEASAIDALREVVVRDLNSEKRREELDAAYREYLLELSGMLRSEMDRRLRSIEMSQQDAEDLKAATNELIADLERSVSDIICPGFRKLREKVPKHIERSAKEMRSVVDQEIQEQPNGSKERTVAYVQSHLVSAQARMQAQNLEDYLRVELEQIARKVEDRITTAISSFETSIEVRFGNETMEAIQRAGAGVLGKVLSNSLETFFEAYGGAAGAGAGIANAASKLLKKVGGWFGKTFSKRTYNTLEHVLAKIGLTSTKTLGAIVSAGIEAVIVSIDYATWKQRLTSKVNQCIDHWAKDTKELVDTELQTLETENVALVEKIQKTYLDEMATDENPPYDAAACRAMLKRLDEIDRRIRG